MKLSKLIIIGPVFLLLTFGGCTCNSKKANTLTKVNITVPQTAYSIPTIIAIEKGFFKENNLDVNVNYVKTGKIALDDLLGGKANFANIVETNIAFAGFNNPSLKVLCNIEKVYDASIVARKDKGISSGADLKGKKIGVMLATTSQVYAERFLEKYGISKDNVTIVNLLPPALQSAIIQGTGVDAISLWEPYIYNVQKALGDNAITFRDKSIFTGYMNLAGNADFVSKNKDAVNSMLKAYIEAENFLKTNKSESVNIVAKVLSLDSNVVEKIWDEYEFEIGLGRDLLDATVSEGKWIISTQKDFGDKKIPDYIKYFDPSYLKGIDESRVKW